MIEIVYKTPDFIVINKPVGIPSQPDPTKDADAMTLASEQLRNMGERDGLFLIHRLDRVVGGLLVFARNKESAAILSKAVSQQEMIKEYIAVVPGECGEGEMRDYLYKDATLSKAFVTDRKRSGVKEARLEYRSLATKMNGENLCSLIKVRLHTGRFHQIRAQFAHRGLPLLGDKKYGSRDFKAKTPSLFATGLSFVFKGKEISLSCLPNLENYPWSMFDGEEYR